MHRRRPSRSGRVPSVTDGADRSRLRWQCRRGMRELDIVLTRYLDGRYRQADPAEKAAFERLLTLSDPELVAYILKREPPADLDLAAVVGRLRR